MKSIHDSYEKSRIVSEILQGKREREFNIFLRIVTQEEQGSKYFHATEQFFSRFIIFPGYEEYAVWPNCKLNTVIILNLDKLSK